jgi:hypothetical protein
MGNNDRAALRRATGKRKKLYRELGKRAPLSLA